MRWCFSRDRHFKWVCNSNPSWFRLQSVNKRLLLYNTDVGVNDTQSTIIRLDGQALFHPREEFGRLTRTSFGYAYTSEFGERWTFDEEGELLTIADRHRLETTFTYDGDRLTAVEAIDGQKTTIAYGAGQITVGESHGRAVTLAGPGAETAPVQSITDPPHGGAAGAVRAFTYADKLVTGEVPPTAGPVTWFVRHVA